MRAYELTDFKASVLSLSLEEQGPLDNEQAHEMADLLLQGLARGVKRDLDSGREEEALAYVQLAVMGALAVGIEMGERRWHGIADTA